VHPTNKDAGAAAKLESGDDGPRTVSIDNESGGTPNEASSGCSFAPSPTHTSGSLLMLAALAVGSLRRRFARVSRGDV
ncbi:MAG: hypothetical protein RJA70_3526, partial [Pseudomonadota bacterium]|jgi:MYXO-CTERM domain-containing protein